MKTLVVVVILVLAAVGPANAFVVELPMTALHGVYPPGPGIDSRTAAVNLIPLLAIHSVSFRVSGNATIGMQCSWDDPQPMPFQLSVNMRDWPTVNVTAWQPVLTSTSGPFTWTAAFTSDTGYIDWSAFLDGDAVLDMVGHRFFRFGCGLLTPASTVEVTEAVLIIDADFALPTPVENRTWGQIKALYQ